LPSRRNLPGRRGQHDRVPSRDELGPGCVSGSDSTSGWRPNMTAGLVMPVRSLGLRGPNRTGLHTSTGPPVAADARRERRWGSRWGIGWGTRLAVESTVLGDAMGHRVVGERPDSRSDAARPRLFCRCRLQDPIRTTTTSTAACFSASSDRLRRRLSEISGQRGPVRHSRTGSLESCGPPAVPVLGTAGDHNRWCRAPPGPVSPDDPRFPTVS
jgi:hypothetical protein